MSEQNQNQNQTQAANERPSDVTLESKLQALPADIEVALQAALEDDSAPMGRVSRRLLVNPEARKPDLAVELGISEGTVTRASRALDVLFGDELSTKSHAIATDVRRRIRAFLDRHELSEATTEYVNDVLLRCDEVVESLSPVPGSRMRKSTTVAESAGMAGIYVYTLPHYLNYPVRRSNEENTADRTFLKVGMSTVDARGRIKQQATTGLPEPPVLLRIYECGAREISATEATIHRILDAFDHNPNRKYGAGKEWFLTSLTALDELADTLGLTVGFSYEDED